MQYSSVDDSDNTSLQSCSLRSKQEDVSVSARSNAFRRNKRAATNSELSQPLTANLTQSSIDEELGDPNDPYFVFRSDLHQKLESVDESLIEYMRIVNETDTAVNGHELKDAKKQLKRHLKTAEANLRDVKKTVQLVESDRQKFGHISDSQLYDRNTFCNTSHERLLKAKEEMNSEVVKEKLLHDEKNRMLRRGGDGLLGAKNDDQRMNTAFVMDNQAQASIMMQNQDETLDELGEVVTRVGEMAENINVELGQQNKLLEQMEEDMTNAEEELGLVMGKLGKFLKTKDKWQLRIILILSLVTFILFLLLIYG